MAVSGQLVYERDELRAIGIPLHSTLDGREQGRWDYTMRHGSWLLLQRFVDAMKAGEGFSFCQAATHDGNPNLDSQSCWLAEPAGDAVGCAKQGAGCVLTTLPPIGKAPAGLQSGWPH
jgi:hypothetical protein